MCIRDRIQPAAKAQLHDQVILGVAGAFVLLLNSPGLSLIHICGERVYQLDAKELGLNDIKDSVSEYFNHLIFAPILNNVYMLSLIHI